MIIRKSIILFIIVFAAITLSCGNNYYDMLDSTSTVFSNTITSFQFLSSLNSGAGVSSDCTATISGSNIDITVPYGTNVTGLITTFATTGQSVTVGGTPQTSGVTTNNFTSPVTYTVTAADSTIQNYTVTVTIDPLTVTAIAPIIGAPNSTVWITNLSGSNFQTGATVTLSRGASTIVATSVNVESTTRISCDIDLAGAATGQWDVTVTNPDSQSNTMINGFTVQTAIFIEDWESGTDGWIGDGGDTWMVPYITGCEGSVSGNYALGIRAATNWNYFDGVHYVFGGITPAYIRFYLKSSWDYAVLPYINFGDDNTATDGGAIFFRWDVNMFIDGDANSASVDCCSFNLVEFRNINYSAHTFDFYVNGDLISSSVPFRNNISIITSLYISLGWYAQTMYIDDIEMY